MNDTEIFEWSRKLVKPGHICFDIGANAGEFTKMMAERAGKNGYVFAFEPGEQIFQVLIKNMEKSDPGWAKVTCVKLALSDKHHVEDVFHYQYWTLLPQGDEKEEWSKERNKDFFKAVFAPLDDWLDEWVIDSKIQLPRIDVMKIDVDGYEEKVIRGAVKTLKKYQPAISLELGGQCAPWCGCSIDEAVRLLDGIGYKFYWIVDKPPYLPDELLMRAPRAHSTNVIAAMESPW